MCLFLPLTDEFFVVFSSRLLRKNSSSVPFHASTTHVREQKEERNFCEHSRLKLKEKAKEEQKFQEQLRLIIVIEQQL